MLFIVLDFLTDKNMQVLPACCVVELNARLTMSSVVTALFGTNGDGISPSRWHSTVASRRREIYDIKEEKSCGMLRPSITELCGYACACSHENIDLQSHMLAIRGGGSLPAARDEYAGGRGLHMGQEWVGAGEAIREVLLRQRDGERPFSPPIFTWSSGEEEVEGAPKPALCAREAYSKAFQLDSDCIVNEDSDIIVTPPFAPLSLANLTSSLTPSPENKAFLRELERLHVASLQHPPLSAHTRFNTLSDPIRPHTPTHAPPHPLARPEALFDSSSADGSDNTASSHRHDDGGDGGITDREQSEHQVQKHLLYLLYWYKKYKYQRKSTNPAAPPPGAHTQPRADSVLPHPHCRVS